MPTQDGGVMGQPLRISERAAALRRERAGLVERVRAIDKELDATLVEMQVGLPARDLRTALLAALATRGPSRLCQLASMVSARSADVTALCRLLEQEGRVDITGRTSGMRVRLALDRPDLAEVAPVAPPAPSGGAVEWRPIPEPDPLETCVPATVAPVPPAPPAPPVRPARAVAALVAPEEAGLKERRCGRCCHKFVPKRRDQYVCEAEACAKPRRVTPDPLPEVDHVTHSGRDFSSASGQRLGGTLNGGVIHLP